MDEADRDYLADMLRYAELAVSILESSAPAELSAEAPKLLALLHAVQTVGEAARQISGEARADFADLPWQDVIGMRHRLVHDYRRTRVEVVLKTVREDLPPLIASLRRALENNAP